MRISRFFYFLSVVFVAFLILELFLRIVPVEDKFVKKITGKGELNVLCLGDSITYGTGCEEKDSFPSLLEQKLNSKIPDKKLKVYNLGKPGLESSEAYWDIVKYFDIYSPDVLTLMIGACNTENYNYSLEGNIYKKNIYERILSKSKTWNIFKLIYLNIYGFPNISQNIVSEVESKTVYSDYYVFPDLSEYTKVKNNKKSMMINILKNKNRGWEYYFKNELKKAEDFFLRNMNDINNIYGLILIYGDYNNINAAIDIIEKNLPANSSDAVLNTYAGVVYGEKGDFKKAFEYLIKGISLSPGDVSIITQFAYVANIAGNTQKAMEYINIALNLDENYGVAYNIAGLINQNAEKTDKSAEYYLKGITKDPGNFINYRDLAYYYASLEEHAQAVKWFEKAISINPYDYDSYKGCAISLLDSADNNDLIKSQEYFIKAEKFNPFKDSIAERLMYDLKRIYELCNRHNVKLILMNYPQADNIVMRRFSERENIPYVDIFSEFVSKVSLSDKFPNKYFLTGKVCSIDGNRLIAEKIYNIFVKENIFSLGE